MNKKVDERTFGAVKALLKSGEKRAKIADYMRVSTWTVSNIAGCGTFEDYQDMTEKRRKKKADEREALRARVRMDENNEAQTSLTLNPDVWAVTPDALPAGSISAVTANYQFNRLAELQRKQTELLEQIAEKLNFIVEMLS